MYSLREYLRALVVAPLAAAPVAAALLGALAVFQGPRGDLLEAAASSALYGSLVALATAYASTLLVSVPFVIAANARISRITRRTAGWAGAATGCVAGVIWCIALSTGQPLWSSYPAVFIMALSSGTVVGLLFEHLLP